MLALVLNETPKLVLDHPRPVPTQGEALVKVRLAGICDTDIELVKGYMGYRGVLGHEFVGEVVSGENSSWSGRRVVADINAGCGRCAGCVKGDGHHCKERTVLGILGRDGALAEYVSVPERCLVAVPDEVSDERAVFAEPLAAALHVLDELTDRTAPVAVLGDGKLGLLIAMSLAGAGVEVVLFGHHEAKLRLAREVGVQTRLSTSDDLGGEQFASVVEATGNAKGLEDALKLVRPRGTLILKTTTAAPVSLNLSAVVVNEVRLVGSRCGDLRRAIETLRRGAVDPTGLIAARYPLFRAEEALAHAQNKGVLKVLVDARHPD